MDFSNIINHMNEHHQKELIKLCERFGNAKDIKEVKLVGVDFGGLDLEYDMQKLRIEFPQKADEKSIKNTIIELCQSVMTNQHDEIKKEIELFKKDFGSIVLATISKDSMPLASYAPLIQINNKNYIYISATAEHFENIKNNPDKIEVMFLEDECKAKSIILRKRLRYKAKAEFIQRGSDEFENALDKLESTGSNGVKSIRNFADFYLIRLDFLEGRFVKGFGGAYLISKDGDPSHIGSNNPHNTHPHGSHLKG